MHLRRPFEFELVGMLKADPTYLNSMCVSVGDMLVCRVACVCVCAWGFVLVLL